MSDSTTEQPGNESDDLSKDEIFELLSNKRRRWMVRFLDAANEPVPLQEFITHIAAKEEGTDPDSVSRKYYKRIQVGLIQTHLPKLQDIGVIEYDEKQRTVALTDAAAVLRPYLRLDRDGGWVPVDLFEDPETLTLVADLPGFDRSDVRIEVEGTTLRLAASRPTAAVDEGAVVRDERADSVRRTVELPVPVAVDDPTVEFDDGVLRIEFLKTAGDRVVTIEL
jgi:HSP20 family molecular chaperone IbpA